MGASEFTGMRKVTITNTPNNTIGTFIVLGADKIGSDGFTVALETNEQTASSFAGDTVTPIGTNIGGATISLLPKSIADLAAVWPSGYDATTESWQPPVGGCVLSDVTFVFEKVCDTKANVILRHAEIALAFELALSRDDTFTAEVMVYPTLSLGSEYGLAGNLATEMIPFQIYDGAYNPVTDLVNYDSV